MTFWKRWRRPGRESSRVITELRHAEAVRRRAKADSARAEALEEHADAIYRQSARLADRNGFAEMILETFDLRT